MLPYFCVYIAWLLCFVTTMTAATFTLFYSLMWGKEVAEQWLASILISNGQDVFVMQPTKVMLAVILVSFLMTRNKQDDVEEELVKEGELQNDDVDILSDNPKERFKQSLMEKMRIQSRKEARLASTAREIVLHLLFVFLLSVVSYGNKNENRFLMTTEMKNTFASFDLVRTTFLYLLKLKIDEINDHSDSDNNDTAMMVIVALMMMISIFEVVIMIEITITMISNGN